LNLLRSVTAGSPAIWRMCDGYVEDELRDLEVTLAAAELDAPRLCGEPGRDSDYGGLHHPR